MRGSQTPHLPRRFGVRSGIVTRVNVRAIIVVGTGALVGAALPIITRNIHLDDDAVVAFTREWGLFLNIGIVVAVIQGVTLGVQSADKVNRWWYWAAPAIMWVALVASYQVIAGVGGDGMLSQAWGLLSLPIPWGAGVIAGSVTRALTSKSQ